MPKKYVVFIPKYDFEIENGRAVKKISEASLSITVESDNIQDAIIKVLADLGKDKLEDSKYSVQDISVHEYIEGQDMRVFIKGVKKDEL